MTQKKETTVLLLSLLITVGAIAGGLWWFKKDNPSQVSAPPDTSTISSRSSADRLSTGEKILISQDITLEKQAGVTAFANGDYPQAIAQLSASLQKQRNDPEALIYLNNARIGNNKSYSIGVPTPIGSEVTTAKEILRGVAQAQTEINNRGGINGIPLKIAITDDNNDPETAKKIAQTFADNPDILGVVGHFASNISVAAAPVYQKNSLVAISPTSTTVSLSDAGDYIFRTVPNDLFTSKALAKYFLEKLTKQKAAIFYNSSSEYSNSIQNAFTTELLSNGGEIVAESDFAAANFNPANAVQQAIDQGAEALIFLTNSTTLDQAFLVAQVNNHQLPLLSGDSIYKPQTLQIAGKNVVGMVVAVPWHAQGKNNNPGFSQAASRLWGGNVNWRTAMAYDATESLIAGIKANPSRQGIQQTLSKAGFSTTGASGTIKFLPSGDRNQAVQLVKVEADPNSEFGYAFVPVK